MIYIYFQRCFGRGLASNGEIISRQKLAFKFNASLIQEERLGGRRNQLQSYFCSLEQKGFYDFLLFFKVIWLTYYLLPTFSFFITYFYIWCQLINRSTRIFGCSPTSPTRWGRYGGDNLTSFIAMKTQIKRYVQVSDKVCVYVVEVVLHAYWDN